jgi:uncharacterized protein (TIGR03083 family)
MDETAAFLDVLARRRPDDPTACRGWRVRDLVGHLAAGAEEEAHLIEAALRGEPSRPTRAFDEREQVFRDLRYPELLEALARHSGRLADATKALITSGGTVEFTGTRLTGRQVHAHSRSELVLHRWDLAGDDALGHELLAQDDLTDHAVTVLDAMRDLQESAAARGVRADPLTLRLCAPRTRDVRFVLGPEPSLSRTAVAATDEESVVETTAADRLILLWGRQPSTPLDLSGVPESRRDAVRAALIL